jgi:hypothetical protein
MSWIDDIRAATTVAELVELYNELGGANNPPEFTEAFTWRKNELMAQHLGDHLTSLAPAINQLFDDRQAAVKDMQEQGRLWAEADAKLKRLQGQKYMAFKARDGGTEAALLARVNEDKEVFELRLQRDLNDAAMKASYKVIELLRDRWEYMQSLMVTEREADRTGQPR